LPPYTFDWHFVAVDGLLLVCSCFLLDKSVRLGTAGRRPKRKKLYSFHTFCRLFICRDRAIRNCDIAMVFRGFVFEESMKKLIICSDGTWDEPTGPVSNVVKLALSLR